ncbi:MAG TPA: VCBS repeat-containing protein [Verrucomicrobiae bacterium]|nr:VCBS repeat-containing protein [Verrucomicrobiae bacterium]
MTARYHFILFLLIFSAAFQRAEAALNFSVSTIPALGTGAVTVTVADVNGDGKPDLICANYNDPTNTLTVLTNNGSGVFGSNMSFSIGTGVGVVVAADFNGDGKVDLVCNSSGTTLTVLTNSGGGFFTNNVTLNTASLPAGIAVADVNGDGRPDVVCANYISDTLNVFTNTLTGLRANPVQSLSLTAGSHPIWVVAADVNGDGKPDLICANYASNSVTIFTNRGDGVFGFNATVAAGSNPHRVIVADINGDGKPDLIVANATVQQLTLLTNDGSGTFKFNATLNTDAGGAYDVVMADLNGDGRPDLISANAGSSTLTVFTNSTSTGTFSYNSTLILSSPTSQPYCVVAADLNGDGKLDLVTANLNNSTLSMLLNVNTFPAPKLSITQAVGKPVVSWPAWNGGYTLQTNVNLATGNWRTYGGSLGYDGVKNTFTNAPVKNLFFRLMH